MRGEYRRCPNHMTTYLAGEKCLECQVENRAVTVDLIVSQRPVPDEDIVRDLKQAVKDINQCLAKAKDNGLIVVVSNHNSLIDTNHELEIRSITKKLL